MKALRLWIGGPLVIGAFVLLVWQEAGAACFAGGWNWFSPITPAISSSLAWVH